MSEWIEKEEVLKQIDCWLTTGEYKYSNATHYLNKRISSIKPKSEWISVKDRLPEEGENVLTYGARPFYDVVYVNRLIDKKNGEWLYDGVTYWMPLPELPKE